MFDEIHGWKKFGQYEFKTLAIMAVRFFSVIDHSAKERYESVPGATIYLANDVQIDLCGEDYEEFKNWWEEQKGLFEEKIKVVQVEAPKSSS